MAPTYALACVSYSGYSGHLRARGAHHGDNMNKTQMPARRRREVRPSSQKILMMAQRASKDLLMQIRPIANRLL